LVNVFTRKIYKDPVIDCLDFCIKNKGMILYGYVIMSNHIHLAVQSEPESRRAWMLERFKKATESHARNKNLQFWQYANHAEEIYSEKFMWSKLDYIHLNPVIAGIVEQASDYVYSSASNYVGKESILKSVILAANPVVDVLKAASFVTYNRY
jgi:REP element-mobilizing transposase RayT